MTRKPLPRAEGSNTGKFDPKAFAKTLTAEQRKDFRSLGKNTGGNYLGWGKNAATGAGQSASPEEMLRRRYATKSGGKTTGIPPAASPTSIAPPTPPITVAAPGAAASGGGPVVSPSSSGAAMASMSGDGGGGGSVGMGGSMQALNGASRFRQGIGQRMPPVQSASLAALRKIY